MSLAVVDAEAAPVCPLPSTVEGSSQLLARPTPQARQVVGRLALVAELPTIPRHSSEKLDAMRIIDNDATSASKSSTVSLTASHALLPG